ncbi:ATP synthase F1 subunit gamma [Aerococcaceae bacterium WGS1372]
MSSIRDIKKRIENVSSTAQLIKAMDTIASTSLHKARQQMEGVRPIYNELKRQVEELGERKEALTHPYYEKRPIKNTLYIVLTSDRGYVGSYNTSLLQVAMEHMEQGKSEKILAVGSKGYNYFKKQGKNIVRKVTDISDSHVYYGSESLSLWAKDLYVSGQVDEVFIVYSEFVNVLTYKPRVEKFLPIAENYDENVYESDRLYEPDVSTVMDHTVPLYLHMNFFRAISESHTCEEAARMVNMDAAGKNAEELIKELRLSYNRQRQAAITQELNEIIGGSKF